MIVANKQDMVQAFKVEEINEMFELTKITDRKWIVIGSSKDDLKGTYFYKQILTKMEENRL